MDVRIRVSNVDKSVKLNLSLSALPSIHPSTHTGLTKVGKSYMPLHQRTIWNFHFTKPACLVVPYLAGFKKIHQRKTLKASARQPSMRSHTMQPESGQVDLKKDHRSKGAKGAAVTYIISYFFSYSSIRFFFLQSHKAFVARMLQNPWTLSRFFA